MRNERAWSRELTIAISHTANRCETVSSLSLARESSVVRTRAEANLRSRADIEKSYIKLINKETLVPGRGT